jgi:hypothetical protein
MSLLEWNRKKVQNLSASEIWIFILGRALMSFGVGVVAMQYWPTKVAWSGIPAIVVGLALFVIAAKGLTRKPSNLT